MTAKWKMVFPLSVGLIMALLALPATAGAGPSLDSVTGSSKVPVFTPFGFLPGHLHVNGTSDPNGANPRGHFFTDIDGTSIGFGIIEFEGNITCMSTSGNTNNNGGVVTASNSPLVPVGSGVVARVVDNGQGSTATGPDETAGAQLRSPPSICPVGPFIPTEPIDSGNYVVKDAP
jgi:hypothetical protein